MSIGAPTEAPRWVTHALVPLINLSLALIISGLLIAALGFLTERPEFLDLAVVYALINFIGTIAVLKFFEYGDLGHQHRDEAVVE